jgi:hypothetical protein
MIGHALSMNDLHTENLHGHRFPHCHATKAAWSCSPSPFLAPGVQVRIGMIRLKCRASQRFTGGRCIYMGMESGRSGIVGELYFAM